MKIFTVPDTETQAMANWRLRDTVKMVRMSAPGITGTRRSKGAVIVLAFGSSGRATAGDARFRSPQSNHVMPYD